MSISIGDAIFSTKAAAKQFARAIRDRYADGARLDQEDEAFVRALLARHPEAKDKIGPGVAFFTVATETEFRRTRHFVVHRLDGKRSDFSFAACIDGPHPDRDRLEALRRAVEDQILAFREQCFSNDASPVCPLRGVPLTRRSSHVDHAPPDSFQMLVKAWLQSRKLKLAEIEVSPPADNQIVARLTDPEQAVSWADFHRGRARLRLLSPRGNLSEARRTDRR